MKDINDADIIYLLIELNRTDIASQTVTVDVKILLQKPEIEI